MAEPKTKKSDASVDVFLAAIANETRREDCRAVVDIMQKETGEEPVMWGTSIIGFGSYHCTYASGRVADWPLAGVSPRKASLSLYIMAGFDRYEELLSKLGKHKTGKSCLYINKLADIHIPTLRKLIKLSIRHTRKMRR